MIQQKKLNNLILKNMKKFFVAICLLALVQVSNAQDSNYKNPNAAKAAVDAALPATLNAKKNIKAQTWVKLGQAYVTAYNAPKGPIWTGISRQELMLLDGGNKPTSTEEVIVGGQPMTKEVYATKNLYISQDGRVGFIEVTAPVFENALDLAQKAFATAGQQSDAVKKEKDIVAGLEQIQNSYLEEAYMAYSFGDYAKASELFEKTAAAVAVAPMSRIDTNSIYNTAFTAYAAGNFERAKSFFDKCLEYEYYSEGEVYSKLADIAEKAGDQNAQVANLETGFTKFPQSQSILVGLINYYINNGENSDRLFELLDAAKVNEPDNASLYYVEGNIRLKFGQEDLAVASYDKCTEINPSYEFGYIGKGIMFYNKAVEIQEAAQNEFDDNKYMALVAEFEQTLKACIEPFEKAFEITQDKDIRTSVAEYLKNACFRFRTEDASFQEKYDFYNNVINGQN